MARANRRMPKVVRLAELDELPGAVSSLASLVANCRDESGYRPEAPAR